MGGCATLRRHDRPGPAPRLAGPLAGPKDKRCYQKLAVLPGLDQLQLEREKTTLVILKPDTDFQKFFAGQKFKNRVAFLTAVDQTGIFNVNKKAQRLWAISQVVKDLTPDDSQYKKAKDTEAEYQTELFLAIKAVFNKFHYPLIDDEQETALIGAPLLDGYVDQKTGLHVKYRNEDASKGEFVVEATLREANKFQRKTGGARLYRGCRRARTQYAYRQLHDGCQHLQR